MSLWRKKAETQVARSGVARAALAGVSRTDLIQEALGVLEQEESSERIGVWLEYDPSCAHANNGSAFHGLVWDRASSDIPFEWGMLSLEPPLPEALLFGRETVEQNLEDVPANLLIGPLVGLRHAMWVPVVCQEKVHGLLLLGGAKQISPALQVRGQAVAAELALSLELEEHRRMARVRTADLTATKTLLESSSNPDSIDKALSQLADECVAAGEGRPFPVAAFVCIGELLNYEEYSDAPMKVAFRWCSGDQFWTRAVESEPIAKIWRRAADSRQVAGSEPPGPSTSTPVARIVAYPLEARGKLRGVFVLGLLAGQASLTALDRVQLRALLAASALERRATAEEESQRGSSQLALVSLLNEPVLLFDETDRISGVSRGARELLQHGRHARAEELPAALPSERLADLFSGRDRERVERWFRESLSSSGLAGPSEKASVRVQLHNGIDVLLQWVPRMAGQRAVILRQSQQVLPSVRPADQADSELRNVIEWLEEGVVLFDADENVRAMNTRFEQMMGLAPEQSGRLRSLEALIAHLESQAADPGHFASRWRELAGGTEAGSREELQMTRPAPRILERAARPVLDSNGRQLGRVEIYRDLTAQRVFQSRLLQTEKLASLGQMVSGIAHELSNPLTSILGYAQRLLVRQDASGGSQEIRQIYQEAERAGAILRQLLLNAREALPERRLVSLNQIVMRAMELQRFNLAAGKIRAEMDLDQALPLVQGDPGQLQQVLLNLLGNARQALEQQGTGGVIQVRTRRISERRVLLEVEDTGPGIPRAIQARIFDPFFTTKPAGVGTGLGLSIVLSVVREHGGQVRVLSPPQGGTTFCVELPVASERQQEEARSKSTPARKKAGLQTVPLAGAIDRRAAGASGGMLEVRKGARVLVVEDEPTVARLIADVLEDEGMKVDVLLDGGEALERAGRETYDLVICDMKMPGLDGQHFYKSLERAGNPLRERFLFVTGDIMGAQTREFLERHRLPHVAKPFRVEELTEKVREVLTVPGRAETSEAGAGKKNAARNG